MVKLVFAEATRHHVHPLDERKTDCLIVEYRPSLTQGRTASTYPNLLHLPEGASPNRKHKKHEIIAKVVIHEDGAAGMLFRRAGASPATTRM